MCGRFLLFTSDDYEELLSIIKDVEINNLSNKKKVEVYPGDNVPIIASRRGIENTVMLSKWGFSNIKEKKQLLINARGETLEEKPTFKKLIYKKNCLIPSIGFYEWKKVGNNKDKYLIRPKSNEFFYMAGLYNEYIDNSGNQYTEFVIITTQANKQMSFIHDRMPIIISSKEKALTWLNHSTTDHHKIKKLIEPFTGELYLENENKQLQFEM